MLVNRHAPFAWGPNVGKAVETAVAIECIAHMALMSLQLAPGLEPIETELLDKHFKRKHGAGAYYGQAARRSRADRKVLNERAARGCRPAHDPAELT